MMDRIIYYSFVLIFALIPFVWLPTNYELFEYNKMMLTYGLTIVIVGAWILKMISQKSLIISRTPLDIPLLLFLGANIISTIFSIDQHTSIWGYYSRSNGGLLSIVAYTLLYFAFVSNMTKEQALKILRAGIISGVLISIWAIMEHFGVSLSCVILRGELTANCWVQDVQARVFATLGQPNWLAAYLAMLIFPAIYFAITSTNKKTFMLYTLYSIIIYLAFTFTFSRGGTLGFLAGLFVLITLLLLSPIFPELKKNWLKNLLGFLTWIGIACGFGYQDLRNQNYLSFIGRIIFFSITFIAGVLFNYRSSLLKGLKLLPIKPLLLIIGSFLIVNLLFGSALIDFKLLQQFSPPPRPGIAQVGTQLESGGTESGKIRLIVWKGAIEIFKHYPIFGSGVETFAYSYYKYRPVEHNLVSEWDFLYNKAHNEYLNYLATTGVIGFSTYLLLITTFVVWCILRSIKNKVSLTEFLLILSLLTSYISYLVQNIFSFSVVIIALFFFLFPAIVFVVSNSISTFHLPPAKIYHLFSIIYSREIYTKITKGLILLIACYLLLGLIRYWHADTLYAKGERENESSNVGAAFNYLYTATEVNPNEPIYKSELAYAAAGSALALAESDATLSAQLKDQSITTSTMVLGTNPNNPAFWRTAFRTYLQLSEIDPSFKQVTIDTLDQAILLAPTDPKIVYQKGLILNSFNRVTEAEIALEKAVELKTNYREALITLGQVQFQLGQKDTGVTTIKKVLEFIPNDPEVIDQLNKWGQEGVATESGKSK
jgi:putative inorganic carbon (hco3(-)) transporter